MAGPLQLVVVAIAATVTLTLADNRPPGQFYPGDNPKWPVPTKCPDIDPKNYTVHLADEKDCTKFYKCLQGRKILMECPIADAQGNKLHFNRILQVCDWPERAMCADNGWTTWKPSSTLPESTTETTETTQSTSASTEKTTLEVTEEPGEPGEPGESGELNISKNCLKKLEGVRFSHEYDRTRFYECRNGKMIIHYCQRGLVFSLEYQSCVLPLINVH